MRDKSWSVISVVAACVSICVAIYATNVQMDLASTDYDAREAVKYDTVKLLSTLRALMHKGAIEKTSVIELEVDIKPEKKAISDFINSSTGYAYRFWINKKSLEAEMSGRDEENWRLFFLHLAEITSAIDISFAASRAAKVELLLDELNKEGVSEIADFNYDLEKAISQNAVTRKGDVIAQVYIMEEQNRRKLNESFESQLSCLKEQRIKDPNIDLVWAIIMEDEDLLNEALDDGANLRITNDELLSQYERELQNCKEEARI